MFAIQKRLKTRRIFRNLESFVGGRDREGDYRLLKRTDNGKYILFDDQVYGGNEDTIVPLVKSEELKELSKELDQNYYDCEDGETTPSHGQNFDEPPTDDVIVSFFKELGHTGDIKSTTNVVDQMHQP
ncbi:hypothetical protein Tco_1254271 [Tanacetum coccineum]